jgi:hypothetical protein
MVERNRNRKEEVEVVVEIMGEIVMEIVHCKLKILILYEQYI